MTEFLTSDLIIGIDAASSQPNVTILDSKGVNLASQSLSREKNLSNSLVSEIDQMLTNVNLDRSNIQLVTLATGPGNYTGLRIAGASALGLEMALQCQLNVFSLFDANLFPDNPKAILLYAISQTIFCWADLNNSSMLPHAVQKGTGDDFQSFRQGNEGVDILTDISTAELLQELYNIENLSFLKNNFSFYLAGKGLLDLVNGQLSSFDTHNLIY